MTRLSVLIGLALVAMIIFLWSCNSTPDAPVTEETEEVAVRTAKVPDWHKNATIYEVNLRHFTPEGTISAFREHLPRLKDLGIDILWFMPVQPVSVEKRKGELGSPYAVGDYTAINPDYGTMDDFREMLVELHGLGMHCIIDWVPNHTGWDNPWITEHPDWYTQDEDGNIVDPLNPETGKSWGWTDVADLNYDVPEMRLAMIDAMRFWIE
ncbi:MAG: alpha-amylase family glycosyl hydrolase, partial [Bacteroidota bacterium]